jgi:hypothetical protein
MGISSQINSTVEYLKSTVILSSANIKAMYATPVLILPARGPNTVVVLHDVFYEYVYTAPAYTGSDGNGTITLQYGNTVHAGSPNFAAISNSLLSNTQNMCSQSLEINLNLTGAVSGMINTGIYASNGTSAYAAGNSLVNMTLFYSVIRTIN